MKHLLMFACLFLTASFVFAQPAWHQHTILDNVSIGGGSTPADIDGDGHLDVLVTRYSALVWLRNVDGMGITWAQQSVGGYPSFGSLPMAADLDNDGDLDAGCYAGTTDNRVRLYANLSGDGTSWSPAIQLPNSLTSSLHPADIDGDGDLDIAGEHTPNMADPFLEDVKWWENVNGDGTVWAAHIVDAGVFTERTTTVIDVDSDGDVDIVSIDRRQEEILWFENDGTGLGWSTHLITDTFVDGHSLKVGDIDSDGDPDLLIVDEELDKISWWENLDGSGLSWDEHIVISDWVAAYTALPGDIDGDGDLDVVGTAYETFPLIENQVAWWENLDGSGLTWAQHFIEEEDHRIGVHALADINGDGRLDILAASSEYETFFWWEQTDPDPVTLTLTPTSSTELPANGGVLAFDAHLVSELPGSYPGVMFWTKAKLPNGNFYPQLLYSTSFTLLPFMDATASLTQDIPSFAPAGTYELWGWVGINPNGGPSFSDYFEFTKSEAFVATQPVGGWEAGGTEFMSEDASSVSLPGHFEMSPVHPNPFNSSATIRINLPVSSPLTVQVYNVSGQQVAELADGQFAAGTHALNLDASGLASGIYFVHTVVPGQLSAVQRVVLLK